tara:strand:- start:1127 stop:1252 length:126 start_codon:yes stop_codon:yes gene_type:complete
MRSVTLSIQATAKEPSPTTSAEPETSSNKVKDGEADEEGDD